MKMLFWSLLILYGFLFINYLGKYFFSKYMSHGEIGLMAFYGTVAAVCAACLFGGLDIF